MIPRPPNYNRMLRSLRRERDELGKVISILQDIQAGRAGLNVLTPKKAGHPPWTEEQRRKASDQKSAWWEKKRKERQAAD